LASPSRKKYDTIVAGAGPAGVMAAYEASRRGDVLLLDSAALPREKVCGGMLHTIAQRFLETYGPLPEGIILDPAHVHFRYVDWDRGIRKATTLRFVNVDRAGFDDWLFKRHIPPDVEVVSPCAIEGFAQDDDGVLVTLNVGDERVSVWCENLIGADGARSVVRRELGLGAVATYVTLQDHVRLDAPIEPFFDCIYMRGVGDGFAYSYLVPKGDTALFGSVFYPKAKRPWDMQDRTLDVLRAAIPQLGDSVKREAAAALYVRSREDTVPGAGRVLLAGEAGGFMSPSSGEGISYALETGLRAGLAVAENGPREALAAYRRSTAPMARDIRRRLRWLPFMESRAGKYIAGFAPDGLVDVVTQGI
jgi:flavin-dependent dehydrogenase